MKQTELHLSTADRVVLDGLRGKGVHPAREVNRARLLTAAERGIEWKFARQDADRGLRQHYVS